MSFRIHPRSALTVFFIVVFAYILYESDSMPEQAQIFPWTVALIALALLVWTVGKEVLFSHKGHVRETGADIDFSEEEASAEGKKRALELFGWVYGFALALWLIGFFIAIPVMIFIYLLRHRENWAVTIIMPAAMGIATWALFNNLLHLPFPPGVVFEMLGIE